AIDVNMAGSYYYLGSIQFQEEKWDNAIAYFRQADTLQYSSPDLQEKLAFALQQRASSDLESALEIYFNALASSSNPAEIYHNIANILVQQSKLAQALVYANEARKLQPKAEQYINLIKFICQQRSKLYEPSCEFKIPDHRYNLWHQSHVSNREKLRQLCSKLANLTETPLLSIVLPVTTSAITWIEDAIAAIQAQIYPYWELCLAIANYQEANLLADILKSYQKRDYRIKVEICQTEKTVGEIANQALNHAQGEFIVLLEEHTLLAPDALLELAGQLTKNSRTDIIYADQDCLVDNYILTKPWFKPDWNQDLLLSRNYFGALVLCRNSLVKKVNKFQSKYNNQYIYALLLKLTEITKNILHIPKILSHHNSNLPVITAEKDQVIMSALKRRNEPGKIINNPDFPQIQTIRYQIRELALVSIIILTRNLGKMLNQCLESIFSLTTYPNFEVIVVDNGSDELESLKILKAWTKKQPEKLHLLRLDIPFNYSLLNNQAVEKSRGKYLLFLNNDTEVISPDWIGAMVEQAQRKSIGAVGALLLYADNTVQHAGIVLGVTGIAGHSHRNFSLQEPGYYEALVTTANYSAVTAACMMCRRETFEEVGKFNEQLAVAYNDVDLCLKLKQQGYNNIFLPHVRLYHYESQSRSTEDTIEEKQRIQQEVDYMEKTWDHWISNDPGYNINLTREQEDYSISLEPSVEVTAIFLREIPEDELWGFFLDEPKLGCVKRNFLDIIGWVVGRTANAIAIEILWGNNIMVATDIKENRPDVAQVYPQLAQAANSGFATTINILDLPQNAILTLQTVLANKTKVKLGTIHLSVKINH
ncbi:MAG: glycosyltransferase, partial [Cyanobacteria bacterium P01_F01_bin.143]